MTTSENFYRDLRTFADFGELSEDRHYEKLPRDWSVVITDVRGSTKAIEQGRYQDVNMLGAASVAVLGQLWKDNSVPFAFGGDGASILVPPSRLDEVKRELLKLRNLAFANYGLDLRVGIVPMSDVASRGLDILVAKFATGPSKPIAFMRGGGLSFADTAIKQESERYGLRSTDETKLGEVKDLSCRWQPLKSQKGQVLSILIRSADGGSEKDRSSIFPEILRRLEVILGGDVKHASPVQLSAMKYKSLASSLKSEVGKHASITTKAFWRNAFWIWINTLSIKYKLIAAEIGARYVKQIGAHSDFRKFDDMLRLVIDCSRQQADEIRSLLEALYRDGLIFYGLHQSDHAIMTCLVGSVQDGDHIHFIDGGAGGYAMAAKTLKDQIAMAARRASG